MKLDGKRLFDLSKDAVLLLITGFLVIISIKNLDSRFQHDTACMLFSSHLIEHFHKVPYRDFFDANLPFAYVIYAFMGITTGYRDRGIRYEELGALIFIVVTVFYALKAFGLRLAWFAGLMFALYYQLAGYFISLQREFFIVAILSAALAFTFNQKKPEAWSANYFIGILCGLNTLIKPHTLPFLLLFFAYQAHSLPDKSQTKACFLRIAKIGMQMGVGFMTPVAGTLGYMIATHSLSPFLDMALNYFPLYGQLNGQHRTMSGSERNAYLLDSSINFIQLRGLLFQPIVGILVVSLQPKLSTELQRKFFLLVGLGLYSMIYPAFSGQFWAYHYLPFVFFGCLLGAFLFRESPLDSNRMARFIPAILQISCLLLSYRTALIGFRNFSPVLSPREGRVDKIAKFLKENLKPGETVQPLDWTNSLQHAMLIANAPPATYFYYDVMFYHHLSKKYPHQARARFMSELTASHPRFIIEIPGDDKPWVSGDDTTREFPELRAYIASNYHKANDDPGYVIYDSVRPQLTKR